MQNYSFDINKFSHLHQSNVIDFLSKRNFSATISSISKYTQLGLMMKPMNKKVRIPNMGRTFYNALSVVEYMTTFLLFRGDWLSVGSKDARIPRLTSDDIFIGRLLFFKDSKWLVSPYIYKQDEFLFTILSNRRNIVSDKRWYELGYSKTDYDCYMRDIPNFDLLDDNLNTYIGKYVDDDIERIVFGKAYSNYYKTIYKHTFMHLYEKYIDDILNPQKFLL